MTLTGLIVPAGCAHGVMQLENAVSEPSKAYIYIYIYIERERDMIYIYIYTYI